MSKAGFPGLGPRSRDRHTLCVGDLLCIALLNGDRVPINRRSINAAARGADIEGNAVGSGYKRQVVSADLVGNIAIGSNTITAHHHGIHFTPAHQQSTGSINNHGAGNPETTQFPGRESSPLQAGTRFHPARHGTAGHGHGRLQLHRGRYQRLP